VRLLPLLAFSCGGVSPEPAPLRIESISLFKAQHALALPIRSVTQLPLETSPGETTPLEERCHRAPPPASLPPLPEGLSRPATAVLRTDGIELDGQRILTLDLRAPSTQDSLLIEPVYRAAVAGRERAVALAESCSDAFAVPPVLNILLVVEPTVDQSWLSKTMYSLYQASFPRIDIVVHDPTPTPTPVAVPLGGLRVEDLTFNDGLVHPPPQQAAKPFTWSDLDMDGQLTVPDGTGGARAIPPTQAVPRFLGLPVPPSLFLGLESGMEVAHLWQTVDQAYSADSYCITLTGLSESSGRAAPPRPPATPSIALDLPLDGTASVLSFQLPPFGRSVSDNDLGFRCALVVPE